MSMHGQTTSLTAIAMVFLCSSFHAILCATAIWNESKMFWKLIQQKVGCALIMDHVHIQYLPAFCFDAISSFIPVTFCKASGAFLNWAYSGTKLDHLLIDNTVRAAVLIFEVLLSWSIHGKLSILLREMHSSAQAPDLAASPHSENNSLFKHARRRFLHINVCLKII